jgi:hypothetical protein
LVQDDHRRSAQARGEINNAAARVAATAYANIPTSRDLRFGIAADGQIIATGTDETTGKVVSRRILSPQRFGAQLMGVLPENFEKLIVDIAEEDLPELQPPIIKLTTRAARRKT